MAGGVSPPVPPGTDRVIMAALEEDLGTAGDLTTDAIVPPGLRWSGRVVARDGGVVAGVAVAARVWELLDRQTAVEAVVADGSPIEPGTTIATVTGPARAVLTGERTASARVETSMLSRRTASTPAASASSSWSRASISTSTGTR